MGHGRRLARCVREEKEGRAALLWYAKPAELHPSNKELRERQWEMKVEHVG